MTPAAVLLDCDGVLVDSEPAAFDLLEADFAAAGLPLPRAVLEAEFQGGTIPGVMAKAREWGAALPDGWVADFYERLYARLAAGTALMPGVAALLDRLDAAGIPYAVGSNGNGRKMAITLGQHPAVLARLAGRMFSGQELGTPKPHPGLWLHCAAVLGVAPGACAVVDDSPAGITGGLRAGMRAYGLDPNGHGARLTAAGAVAVVRRLADLPALWGL
jgi:HAD superfamily hydrolase (TIGR01509 family)